MVNFTFLDTTNLMISIYTSQTFRSRIVIFHLGRSMALKSLSIYDTPRLLLICMFFFWGLGDFQVTKIHCETLDIVIHRPDFSLNLWPWYRTWHLPYCKWFPWRICKLCDMSTGNTDPSGHLVPSLFGTMICLVLAYVPILEISFPELAVFSRLFTLNITR